MGARPVEKLAKLIPIGHVFEGKMFNRRAGEEQAIKLFIAGQHFGEGAIEALHVFCGHVFGAVFRHAD